MPHRAEVVRCDNPEEPGIMRLLVIYEHEFGSPIRRTEMRVPHGSNERIVTSLIAAAWQRVAYQACEKLLQQHLVEEEESHA